jgi:hypothetical protein
MCQSLVEGEGRRLSLQISISERIWLWRHPKRRAVDASIVEHLQQRQLKDRKEAAALN